MLTNAQKIIHDTQAYIASFGMAQIHGPQVIFTEKAENMDRISELLKFAKNNNASWIVASSHGRSGLSRIIFGSFAENLLLKSTWPVMFLRDVSSTKGENTALFPTDFSSNSHRAFQNFLRSARLLKTDVVLFHSFGLPYFSSSPGIPSGVIPPDYYQNLEADAKIKAKIWIAEAKLEGVKASLLLKNIGMGFVNKQEIVNAAVKAKASLIAMATTSKKSDRFLLGSAAYDVFRANKYPVWIYGPKAVRANLSGRAIR